MKLKNKELDNGFKKTLNRISNEWDKLSKYYYNYSKKQDAWIRRSIKKLKDYVEDLEIIMDCNECKYSAFENEVLEKTNNE